MRLAISLPICRCRVLNSLWIVACVLFLSVRVVAGGLGATGVVPSRNFVNFGTGTVGSPATATVSFTVPSGVTLGGVSVVTQGVPNLDFTAVATGTNCGTGTTATVCNVEVQFQATAPGSRYGAIVITDQAANTVTVVPLYGVGLGPMIGYGPGTITTIANIGLPNGVAIDPAGNIYVADTNNHAIRKIAPGGAVTTFAGGNGGGFSGDGGPATSAQLYYPGPPRLDGAGNVYFADWGNNRIRVVTTGGVIQTIAGGGPTCSAATNAIGDGCPATQALLNGPWGTAIDASGNFYIGDYGNNVVRVVTSDGIISTFAGNYAKGPGYSGDGLQATAAQLNSPQVGAFDTNGNLYIADVGNDVIRMVTPAGIISTFAGNYAMGPGYSGDSGPATSAQLSYPQEVTVDAANNVYIADSGNFPNPSWGPGVIRKVTPLGVITTVAGNGTQGYSGDNGPATSAQLNGPWDVAIDALGNMYVADAYNNAIRKVSLSTAPTVSFPNTAYQAVSPAQDVQLLNLGSAPIAFGSIGASPNFSLNGPDNSCSAGGEVLLAGGDCILGIEFAPQTVGPVTGKITLNSNLPGTPQMISLQGTATQASQTIYFANPGTQPYGVAPLTLGATATSGLAVTYKVTQGPANVNGNMLTITGAGSVTVEADQFGDANYAPASPASVSFTVTQAALTVVVNSSSRSTAQPNPTFTGTVGGVVNNDITTGQLVVTYSTTATQASPIGKYPITASLSGPAASSYALTVTPGTLTIWATGIDLIETSVSAPANAAAGATITVSDTTQNEGISAAGNSLTYYYWSTNGTTKGTYLGYRSVGPLSAGATSAGALNVSVPAGINGNYYVLACSNGSNSVTESNTANNCTPTGAVAVAGPDLVEGNVTAPATVPSGSSMSISDTVTNQGSGTATPTSTYYYLSTNGTTKGTYLGYRSVPGLNAGAASGGAASVTMPTNTNGTYYVIACANATNSNVESNSNNDCFASAAINVSGADLVESSVTGPATGAAGSSISITDTVTNQGGGAASGTTTNYYLSTNGTTKGSSLGYRSVSTLAGSASSTGTVALALPAGINGSYYVIACANATNSVVESNPNNNCTATTAITVSGADLVENTVTAPSTAAPGSTISVSDTVLNQGGGAATATTTNYYFSTNGTSKGTYLGYRSISALGVSASSSGSASLRMPTGISGSYYVIACANATNSTAETNTTNNCTASNAITVGP